MLSPAVVVAIAVPLLSYTVMAQPRRVSWRVATQTYMSTLPKHQYQPEEQNLIRRVAEGDKTAFYELVRPYEKAIYLAAKSVLENDADAEDASQEAVLKAFTHIKSFRGDCKFGTWLYQITLNEARAKLRKEHRDLYEHLDEPSTDEQGDYWPSDYADWRQIPSDALALKQLREALSKALSSLEPKYRQVLLLRDVQHLSAAETAEMLGISEENVRTRLHRARLRMRDALAPGFDGAWTKGRAWQVIRAW
jgi:RNA polymerase sigma-70 factor, ECF subfamily